MSAVVGRRALLGGALALPALALAQPGSASIRRSFVEAMAALHPRGGLAAERALRAGCVPASLFSVVMPQGQDGAIFLLFDDGSGVRKFDGEGAAV